MTEQECKSYVKDYIPKLETEILNIITENKQFYENFDISFSGNFTGFTFERDPFNNNKLIISDISMSPNCKLKLV